MDTSTPRPPKKNKPSSSALKLCSESYENTILDISAGLSICYIPMCDRHSVQ